MRKAAQRLLLVFVFLGSIIFCVPARAQISFSFTLPVAFQVEEIKFPKGTYLIKQEAPDKKITIRSQKGSESGQFGSSGLEPQSPFARYETWLVFHRYGDTYFLSEIWSRHLGRLMTVSSAEKQLLESGVEGTDVRVNLK